MLVWLGALTIGLSLGLLGSGGSILTVPMLVYLVGQPEKLAIAGSLAIVGTIALVGGLPYMWQRQTRWHSVFVFGFPGMLGTYGGAWLAKWVPGAAQLLLFAVVMLLAAWMMLRPTQPQVSEKPRPPRAAWKVGLDGLAVGVLTGLVGVGGGFLIVPALALLGGLTMRQAVATSLPIITMNSFTGFYKYTGVLAGLGLTLNWSIIGLFCGVGIVGSLAGNVIAGRLPQHLLRRIFGVFLILMSGYIIYRTLPEVLPPSARQTAQVVSGGSAGANRFAATQSTSTTTRESAMTQADLHTLVPNALQPGPALTTGGQPSPGAFGKLAQQGYRLVINLRPASEMQGRDEAAEVSAAGMQYAQIPIAGAADITRQTASELDELLKRADGPVLVHCASGNRVGALLAARAAWLQGLPAEQALEQGKAAGMTKLTADMACLLSASC